MELGKKIHEAVKLPFNGMKFLGHQMLGGAFGELGDSYGKASGGYDVHPASIQFFTTGEQPPKIAA